MTAKQVLAKLKAAGTSQNVKVYKRHGATEPLFGVSTKDLKTLQKSIGVDHTLALELWDSGNFDARILALMIADPNQSTWKQAEGWLRETEDYMVSNYLGGFVAKTSFGHKAFRKWSKSKKEIFRHCGYDVLNTMLKNGTDLDRKEAEEILQTIEVSIHSSPNRARNAMNMSMIAIGVYCKGMTRAAKATARRIGPVHVDHGETSCKTPDAIAYIDKSLAHRKAKARAK